MKGSWILYTFALLKMAWESQTAILDHFEDDEYFFIETNGFFLLSNLYFAVRGVFCTILLFLMYFYCKILNYYYFEAF